METETKEIKENTVKLEPSAIYEVGLKNTRALYDFVDRVDQHRITNSYNYDLKMFFPAQEIITEQKEQSKFLGAMFRLSKPVIVRVEVSQVNEGNPRAIIELVNKLKADKRWTVTPIKETVELV